MHAGPYAVTVAVHNGPVMLWFLPWLWIGCADVEPVPERVPAPDPVPATGVDAWELIQPAARDGRWAKARCNDGSMAGFDLRRSATGSKVWLVQVAGGFFCDDHTSACSDRPRRLSTAHLRQGGALPDGTMHAESGGGLFARKPLVNKDFHDANHVVFHYCSSDFWLGETVERVPTTGASEGWYFSGRHVFRADLEALVSEGGMDLSGDGAALLLVGSSAGGIGLAANIDTVTEVLGEAVAQGRVKALLDGAWVPEGGDPSLTPVANQWGPLHKACEADRAAAGQAGLACVFGPVWLPYWQRSGIPLLVQQSGLDTTQTRVYGIDTAQEAARWRERSRASLAGLDHVFSGGHRYHTVAFDGRQVSRGPKGSAFNQVLQRFWGGGEPEAVMYRYEESD